MVSINKKIRIAGIVKAEKLFRNRMMSGIEMAERRTFLKNAGFFYDEIEKMCREHGMTILNLPAPSRTAIVSIKKMADLRPDQLPLPTESRKRVKPIRIAYVIGWQDDLLKDLALAVRDRIGIDPVNEKIREIVSHVEAICKNENTVPAGMPLRNARAYAMMKWLTVEEHFDLYMNQVRRALPYIEEADACMKCKSKGDILVLFTPSRHYWHRKVDKDFTTWRLGLGYLAASGSDFRDLKNTAAKLPPAEDENHFAFTNSGAFRSFNRQVDQSLGGLQYNPRGCAYDLDLLFDRVNERFFNGKMTRPHLHWRTRRSTRSFGSYSYLYDLVELCPSLDDSDLPETVPCFILYHELLHKKYPPINGAGPHRIHHHAFQEAQKRFPEFEKVKKLLAEVGGNRQFWVDPDFAKTIGPER